MYSGNVTEQVEGIRKQSVAVLEDLISEAREFELADPPAALVRYRQKLVSLADTFRSESDRPQNLHTVLGSS